MNVHQKMLIFVVAFFSLMVVPSIVQATTITASTFDKELYLQGQTGYLTVTIHNDQYEKIKITELTATIEYYYIDGTVYVQSFFTNATLPVEIQPGETRNFLVPFSLPFNIAPGYTDMYVKAVTEVWREEVGMWSWSAQPTFRSTIFIESRYRQLLEEQQATTQNTTTMMYLFGATTLIFGVVAVILFLLNRSARAHAKVFTQPIA